MNGLYLLYDPKLRATMIVTIDFIFLTQYFKVMKTTVSQIVMLAKLWFC